MRINEYLAYPSSNRQLLDIDSIEAFKEKYPKINISQAPQYLSRNKILPHIFINLD